MFALLICLGSQCLALGCLELRDEVDRQSGQRQKMEEGSCSLQYFHLILFTLILLALVCPSSFAHFFLIPIIYSYALDLRFAIIENPSNVPTKYFKQESYCICVPILCLALFMSYFIVCNEKQSLILVCRNKHKTLCKEKFFQNGHKMDVHIILCFKLRTVRIELTFVF